MVVKLKNDSNGSPRWRRRPTNRPFEIAEAAIDVFSRKGFDTATMDEIAEAAGVSKGTIYLYFQSKEDLLIACVESRMRETISFFNPLFDFSEKGFNRDEIKKAIELILENFIEIITSERTVKLMRLILAERAKSSRLREKHVSLAVEAHARLSELLRKAHKSGMIECPKPEEIARALLGSIVAFPISEALLGDKAQPLKSKTARRAVIDFALRGLGLMDIERR